MCEFINNINEKCNQKNKYGSYCFKHRHEYLINNRSSDANNNVGNEINLERYTNKQVGSSLITEAKELKATSPRYINTKHWLTGDK